MEHYSKLHHQTRHVYSVNLYVRIIESFRKEGHPNSKALSRVYLRVPLNPLALDALGQKYSLLITQQTVS